MPKQCKCWYFEECPFIKDCSVQSWKRDNCGGKTPAMATEALLKHLVRSHKMSDEHATEVLCELCDLGMQICMRDCDDEEIDETQVDEKKFKQCNYWYFEECPFIKDCSLTSWNQATCGGKSPASAKLALIDHLVKSSDHELSEQDAWIATSDTDLKCCMMDDDEIDKMEVDKKKAKSEENRKKVRVEENRKKAKVEENRKKVKVEENMKKVKVEENEKKIKVEEVDKTEPRSVKPTPRKKRKIDDSDRPDLLFDAASKVEQGLHSLRIAKATMLESKLALKKAHLLTRFVARGRASRGSSD